LGKHFEMLLELTEEDALQVAIILVGEEEKHRYPNIKDAMALSMAQLYRLLQGRRHLDATKVAPHSQERWQGLQPLACNSLPRCHRYLLLRRDRHRRPSLTGRGRLGPSSTSLTSRTARTATRRPWWRLRKP
jgi:hypothetical protein